jgi:hypothetical protein
VIEQLACRGPGSADDNAQRRPDPQMIHATDDRVKVNKLRNVLSPLVANSAKSEGL